MAVFEARKNHNHHNFEPLMLI